ncbi:hypothetical protein FQN54_000804 [Arachnomyces sp. PD_36]|nr:hypothetical protein FQN54_000804 [Arachnomyces sp. PD_36]
MFNLLEKWQDFRYRLHHIPETDHAQLSRLARTPPEFWRPKDWTDSRRLRSRRQIALRKAERAGGGHKVRRVVEKFPEGRFWPRTPRYDRAWRGDVVDNRLVGVVRDILGDGVEVLYDEEGEIMVVDPFTGEVVPAYWYVV